MKTSYRKLYGTRVRLPNIDNFRFAESWVEHMEHDILFDNFEKSLRFEPETNTFVATFTCPDCYEPDCEVVVP